MNLSYFRIKLPKEAALERLYKWNEPPKEIIETPYGQAVDDSVGEDGQWKGSCLYMYENKGWTVFEDLSGGFSTMPASVWLSYAENDELVVAGYNDSIPYAELIIITHGVVRKEFLEDISMPEDNVNNGDMYDEINDWTEAAEFVDGDEIVVSEDGTLLIF